MSTIAKKIRPAKMDEHESAEVCHVWERVEVVVATRLMRLKKRKLVDLLADFGVTLPVKASKAEAAAALAEGKPEGSDEKMAADAAIAKAEASANALRLAQKAADDAEAAQAAALAPVAVEPQRDHRGVSRV